MNYATHTQQAIPTSSRDEQALAQAELYSHLESQAEAVAPEHLTTREFDGIKKWQEVEQANLLGKCQSKVF